MLHQCRQQYHNHQHYQEERHLRQLAASNQPRSPLRQLFPAKPTTTTTTTITTKMSAADSRKRIPWNGGSIPADACYLAPEVFEARCKYKYSLFKRKNNCHSYAIVLFHTQTAREPPGRSMPTPMWVGIRGRGMGGMLHSMVTRGRSRRMRRRTMTRSTRRRRRRHHHHSFPRRTRRRRRARRRRGW